MAGRNILSNHLVVRYLFMGAHVTLLLAVGLKSLLSTALNQEAGDIFTPMACAISMGSVLHYLIPVAILCMCNRESRYERAWVEVFYLTYQTMWSVVIVIFSSVTIHPLAVVQALAVVHAAIMMGWFGWTLWLATRGAMLMGPPWTRDKVLRQVSMSKLVRLPQWRQGPDIALDKLDTQA